jgi:hypothetical protein
LRPTSTTLAVGEVDCTNSHPPPAADDVPNQAAKIADGFEQTGNGMWRAPSVIAQSASISAAIPLAVVAEGERKGVLKSLRMCFIHKNAETDSICRSSDDNSLILQTHASPNRLLAAVGNQKLAFTFGRLVGLSGSQEDYAQSKDYSHGDFCVLRTAGNLGDFGNYYDGKHALCEHAKGSNWEGVWHGWGAGMSYKPYRQDATELTTGDAQYDKSDGFRLYLK